MNSDPVVTTDLAFVRKQPIGSMENLQQVANGNYLWNLPESLPQNVTLSVVQDNLRQARGKFRLIQRLGNDPVARRDRQTQFNQLLREVGVEPFLIGTDKVTFENWPDYRLPPPLDDVCAVAQMELLLDVLVPPPFGGNAQMLSRARQEPGSLTPEQLEEFVAWYEATNALLHSSREEVGLDEMFDVTYNKDTFFIHNRTLDHIERLVSMAVDVELGSVRMIKIGKDTDIPEPKDPWNLEVEEEEPAPAQQQGGFGTEMMAMEGMDPGALGFGFGEEMMWGGEFGMYAGAQAAAAPVENMIAHVTPIYIRVTGDYSRVWEYILQLSGGPNLFSIEEMTIYGHNSLPEGHIAADLWVNAPIWVIGIPNETTQRAAEFMANQAVESSAAQTADASPAGQPAESVDDPAAPGGG
jgi:hypothetical protein